MRGPCAYGNCMDEPKPAPGRPKVNITITTVVDQERVHFCCLEHAARWLNAKWERYSK